MQAQGGIVVKLFDIVELAHDLEAHGLRAGDWGTIVDVYNDGEAYEVEFLDPQGNTIDVVTLGNEDVCRT